MFKLFKHLDKALVAMEQRNDYTSKSARIWPSESSVVLIEPGVAPVVGGCHRKTYYRLTGEHTSHQMDPVGARRVRTGKAVEEDATLQAMEAGLHIASGVRMYIPNLDMAFELDLVVLDPSTGQPVICENKSIYGYMSSSQILGNKAHQGKPKLEHVLQTLIYINEIRTGAHLKQVITTALADKESNKRNRIHVSEDNVSLIKDDAQIYGKICYETRDTCETVEFDVEIYEDFDGSHYPQIDGEVWKIFTVESIYDRFEIIQGYFSKAQQEAFRVLQSQGVIRPASLPQDAAPEVQEVWKQQERAFWTRVGEEMRRLPLDFLPPADYQYRYNEHDIEDLHTKGLIGETKYKEWKTWKNGKRRKAGTPIIGDWQCLSPTTLIELEDGEFIPISEIVEGTKTSCGIVDKVISKPTDKRILEIKPYNLLSITVTEDHPIKTSDGFFTKAQDLVPIKNVTSPEFDHELMVPFNTIEKIVDLTDEQLFIIGLWLAEGSLGRNGGPKSTYYHTNFVIHPKEQYLADRIYAFAKTFTNAWGKSASIKDKIVIDKRVPTRKYRSITISSVTVAQFIKKWCFPDVPRTRSWMKKLVPALRTASLRQQRILLDGLIAGDGCDTRMRKTMLHDYTTTSLQLGLDVQRLLWRQGIIAGIVPQKLTASIKDRSKHRIVAKHPSYHIRWYDGLSYSSRIDNGVFYTKIMRIVDYKTLPLVYDLSIPETEEIPTMSGIVHNCRYCNYKLQCIPLQCPDLASMCADMAAEEEDEPTEA